MVIALPADKVGAHAIRCADAVVVALDGKIYLSDASTRFAPGAWGGPAGREYRLP